ncbi:MAG: hypothetical protein AB1941_24395 [Gemmatimonadota bacterium]
MSDQRDPRNDLSVRPGKEHVRNAEGLILLHPSGPVPDCEAWLWKNPSVRSSMERALRQADSGAFEDLGSFTGFSDDGEH